MIYVLELYLLKVFSDEYLQFIYILLVIEVKFHKK